MAADFTKISKDFSYQELCLIENALNGYKEKIDVSGSPTYKKMYADLLQNVVAARSWKHQQSKTPHGGE